jgi:SAM-dependent methyltransferase
MEPEETAPLDPFGREEGRNVFGSVAAEYAAARPDYPDRVYEILRRRCRLGRSSRVLEIGTGSGQATNGLVGSGASVVAVEPNDALAGLLRAELGTAAGLEVIVAAFEDVDLSPSSFDLVAVATAFHWLDPEVSLPKIASVLRPGGWLALWWNEFGDPLHPDPFHDATEPLLRNLAQGPSTGADGVPYALDVAARIRELSKNQFRDVEYEAVRWTLHLDASQTRQLYATYSNIARLPDAQKATILDEIQRIASVEFGDRVERRMVTPIYTAHL